MEINIFAVLNKEKIMTNDWKNPLRSTKRELKAIRNNQNSSAFSKTYIADNIFN